MANTKSKSSPYLNEIISACNIAERIIVAEDIPANIKHLHDALSAAAKAKFKISTFGALLDDKSIQQKLGKFANKIKNISTTVEALQKQEKALRRANELKNRNRNSNKIKEKRKLESSEMRAPDSKFIQNILNKYYEKNLKEDMTLYFKGKKRIWNKPKNPKSLSNDPDYSRYLKIKNLVPLTVKEKIEAVWNGARG